MGNPLIPTVFAADPSAHVWPGDSRLWLYTSHDQPGTNTHDTMVSYHVFSSEDLVNWTDYGVVLHLKDISWAGSHAWANDCVQWRGLYYLVFCAQERTTGLFRTGLATSPQPQGPFTDIGFIQGVEQGQDPALFVDDDGQPYLFWGSNGRCHAARLTDDLRAVVPGSAVELTDQLFEVYEGPWVHKYAGRYYLSYPGLREERWPENMNYATAGHPLGPYTYRGRYIPEFPGQAGTNHGSIAAYKGRWYAFHHSMWVSDMGYVRSLMCDYVEYEGDGTIRPIIPSREGVVAGEATPGPSRVTLLLEAENGAAACGELSGPRVEREHGGFSGAGYVTGFERKNDRVTVMAQQARAAKYRLKIRYRAPTGPQENRILVNHRILRSSEHPNPERFTIFPQTGSWTELDLGEVELLAGDNFIHLKAETGGIDVDYFKLEPTGA